MVFVHKIESIEEHHSGRHRSMVKVMRRNSRIWMGLYGNNGDTATNGGNPTKTYTEYFDGHGSVGVMLADQT
jgi:hypothetical protein